MLFINAVYECRVQMLCTNVAHKYWNHSASVASVFEHLIKTRICVSERTNCAKVGKTEGRGRGRWYNPPNGNLSQKCRKSRGVLDFGKTPADLQKMVVLGFGDPARSLYRARNLPHSFCDREGQDSASGCPDSRAKIDDKRCKRRTSTAPSRPRAG